MEPHLPESPKGRGYLAELTLILEAQKRGYRVLTTGGDNASYDLVIENNGKFHRVQVKSCLKKEGERDRYTFTCKQGGHNKHRHYGKDDIDVLALYTFDTARWYFIPVELIGTAHTIKIDKAGRFDQFCNNWACFD